MCKLSKGASAHQSEMAWGKTRKDIFSKVRREVGKIQIQSPASLALALLLTGTAAAPLTGEEGSALFLKRNALQKHVSKKNIPKGFISNEENNKIKLK